MSWMDLIPSHPQMCFSNPQICKLALSRVFLKIIGISFATPKSILLIACTYLFGKMTKTVWAVFKASRGNTSVERVMCSQQVHQVNQAYADCTNLEQGVDGSSLMRKLRKKEKNVFVPLFVQTGCFLLHIWTIINHHCWPNFALPIQWEGREDYV